jgi:hypothetical protein
MVRILCFLCHKPSLSAQCQRATCSLAAGAGCFSPDTRIWYSFLKSLTHSFKLRSREDENTNLKGHLLILSAELQKRDGAPGNLGRSPSFPPSARNNPSRESAASPANFVSQQNNQGSARGTPVSFSRSTPDHSADFSPSELLARVASMQQQLVEAQVSSLRDR